MEGASSAVYCYTSITFKRYFESSARHRYRKVLLRRDQSLTVRVKRWEEQRFSRNVDMPLYCLTSMEYASLLSYCVTPLRIRIPPHRHYLAEFTRLT